MAEIKVHLEKWRPLKAIRAKCLDCCCGSQYEVSACTVYECPLYEYRFGTKKKSRFAESATQSDLNPDEIEDEYFIEDDM